MRGGDVALPDRRLGAREVDPDDRTGEMLVVQVHGGAVEELARGLELALDQLERATVQQRPAQRRGVALPGEPLLELDEAPARAILLAGDRVEQGFQADADADQPRVARRAPQLLALREELARPGEIAGCSRHARRRAGRQRGA